MRRVNQQKRSMRSVPVVALTVVMACSEPFTPPPPVTLETIAGRYQLELVGKKPLPANGPVICFLEGCGRAYLVTAGTLEIGKLGASTWTMTTSTRDAVAPFVEYTGTRRGTVSVDARGQMTLREDDILENAWSGVIENDVVTVNVFTSYTFRRVE